MRRLRLQAADGSALRKADLRPRPARSMGGPRHAGRGVPNAAALRPLLRALPLLLAGCLLMLLARHAAHWLVQRPMFEIHEVRLLGDLDQVDRDLLRKRALSLHGNFFALDLAAVSAELRGVAWVRQVTVRRIWPDTLEVQIEEHHPLARWNDSELINTRGERYTAEYAGVLPYFQGPAGSEALMMEEYQGFRTQLAGIALTITDLELNDRGAWRLTADNGLELELGRDDVHGRLTRFINIYPQLAQFAAPSGAVVDLRYAHGFALRGGAGSKDATS